MKLQVEAPPEVLQSFKVASAFGSFTIQEPNLNGWSEATAEATLKPCFEASSDCPYYGVYPFAITHLSKFPFSIGPQVLVPVLEEVQASHTKRRFTDGRCSGHTSQRTA